MTQADGETEGGLDWGLGSFVFTVAFKKLATSLWWMFWGLALEIAGGLVALFPLAALFLRIGRRELAFLLPAGMICLAVGSIVMLIGEQKCLHLDVPLGMRHTLPGHRWLRTAYWCHLGSCLLRLARNFVGRGVVAIFLLPLQVIGFVLLLLFLRKTADVLVRPGLRRLVDTIFFLASLTVLSGGVLYADQAFHLDWIKSLPRLAALTVLILPVVLFFSMLAAYLTLLGQLAVAASAFAKYLADAELPSSSSGELPEEPTAMTDFEGAAG